MSHAFGDSLNLLSQALQDVSFGLRAAYAGSTAVITCRLQSLYFGRPWPVICKFHYICIVRSPMTAKQCDTDRLMLCSAKTHKKMYMLRYRTADGTKSILTGPWRMCRVATPTSRLTVLCTTPRLQTAMLSWEEAPSLSPHLPSRKQSPKSLVTLNASTHPRMKQQACHCAMEQGSPWAFGHTQSFDTLGHEATSLSPHQPCRIATSCTLLTILEPGVAVACIKQLTFAQLPG